MCAAPPAGSVGLACCYTPEDKEDTLKESKDLAVRGFDWGQDRLIDRQTLLI